MRMKSQLSLIISFQVETSLTIVLFFFFTSLLLLLQYNTGKSAGQGRKYSCRRSHRHAQVHLLESDVCFLFFFLFFLFPPHIIHWKCNVCYVSVLQVSVPLVAYSWYKDKQARSSLKYGRPAFSSPNHVEQFILRLSRGGHCLCLTMPQPPHPTLSLSKRHSLHGV